jgi:protein phosphatase
MKVPIEGNTPGLRYGHTMVYILPILILFGGSGRSEILNDVWILSTDKVPFKWEKVNMIGNPNKRVYHSANLFKVHGNTEMMIVFGGRNTDNVSVAEISGIKKGKDNDWEWVEFPKQGTSDVVPLARHQHCATFFGPFLFIVGGRVSVNQPATFDAYSMNKHKWFRFGNVALFRHSIWVYYTITSIEKYDVFMYIYGGFDGDNGSMINPDLYKVDLVKLFSKIESLNYELNDYINQLLIMQKFFVNNYNNQKKNQYFTLHGKVVTYQLKEENDENFSNMIKQLSLQKLKEESKKITNNNIMYKKNIYDEDLVNEFMYLLVLPEYFVPKQSGEVFFNWDKERVHSLIKQSKAVLEQQPMVLNVKYPIKIFGSIHGQYNDLMRYFNIFGRPAEYKGDIESFEYLFLGNYCSRGSFGLEVFCLLLALKVNKNIFYFKKTFVLA